MIRMNRCTLSLVCVLILYAKSTTYYSGWDIFLSCLVETVFSRGKCLAQRYNTVSPLSLSLVTLQTQVKHSTIEPLAQRYNIVSPLSLELVTLQSEVKHLPLSHCTPKLYAHLSFA